MRAHLKNWVVRPLLILTVTAIVFVGAGLLLLSVEQESLVNLAIGKVNDQIAGRLTIESSSLSLTRNFPYLSIALHNAQLYPDKSMASEPVCSFDKLYAGFDLPEMLDERFSFRKLFLQGGQFSLVRTKDGHLNLLDAVYTIPDSTDHPQTESAIAIDLQQAILKNATVSFLDESNGRKFTSRVDKLTASFRMDSLQGKVGLKGQMVLDVTSPNDNNLFRHKKFEIDLQAIYHPKTQLLEIDEGDFKLQDATFNIEGTARLAYPSTVDLKMKGDKPDFNLIGAFLPGDVKNALKPFRYDGRVYFDGVVRGDVSPEHMPLIEVSFGCEDAWFLNTSADKRIDSLNFKGYFTNGKDHTLRTSELHITNVNARPGKGIFKGNFIVQDFTNPHTLVQINSELELKFLGEFLGIPDLKQIDGKIKLEMDFKELTNIRLPEESLNKLKEGIQSKLRVEGLSFRIPGYPYPVQNMSLQAEMKDGYVTVDSAFARIGNSNLRLRGSVSDIQAFIRDRNKVVTLTLHAASDQLILKELLSYDTSLSNRMKEEVHNFNVGLTVQTSVAQLLHPSPLPKGQFQLTNLSGSFTQYKHTLTNINATLMVEDSILTLRELSGMIDRSDLRFSGRVKNYELWFENVKKGRTQISFDFKSERFAMEDVLGPGIRKFVPRGYRKEEGDHVWLDAKADLKYDTNFKFVRAEIVNITGTLRKHNIQVKDIKGRIKYGATNKVLVADTLTGMIGRSDFDVSLRAFAGDDKSKKKKTNFVHFKSTFLDIDQLSDYDSAILAPVPLGKKGREDSIRQAKADSVNRTKLRATAFSSRSRIDSSKHAKSFNIFTLPFDEFNVTLDVAKLKYNRLWIKDISVRLQMQEDHFLRIDTVSMKVAGGSIGLKGELNGRDPSQILFKSVMNVDQVDLGKILIKLDHLGQDIVINKNVKGTLSGQVTSDVQVHPNLVPLMNKTTAQLKIRITNGSLVDFAPMQAMSAYFKDKNLRLVRFDTLENELTFTNGLLSIPTMDITSSLGYIQMSGKQSLDLNMEYYVRVPMKMVTKVGFASLFDKKPDEVAVDQVDEIDYADKEKKLMFMNLKVTGTPDDYKVKLGKDKNRKN